MVVMDCLLMYSVQITNIHLVMGSFNFGEKQIGNVDDGEFIFGN